MIKLPKTKKQIRHEKRLEAEYKKAQNIKAKDIFSMLYSLDEDPEFKIVEKTTTKSKKKVS